MRDFSYWLLIPCFFALVACSTSRSSRDVMQDKNSSARPHPATYGTDGFYDERDLPERNPTTRPGEFFFKHCSLSGRNAYSNISDWECSQPQ